MNKIDSALFDLYQARKTIDELTKNIGESLSRCHKSYDPIDGSRENVHIHDAYAYYIDDESGDRIFTEHPYQTVEEYLNEVCPICLETHKLIQERKQQRKLLGIARTKVTKYAKNLYLRNNHEQQEKKT